VSTELTVALIAAAVALVSAAFTIWGQLRTARISAELQHSERLRDRQYEAAKIVSRFREPLAQASFDLQGRFFNILRQGLIRVYHDNGTSPEREYVLNSTAYFVAQYFGWIEIIRREIQFLDLGDIETTRELNHRLDSIRNLWLRDDYSPVLRLFRIQQRAIGERMSREGSRGAECIGYGQFLDESTKPGPLRDLVEDVKTLIADPNVATPRLHALQHALVDLVDALDPAGVRFPPERRKKV
jgi:hypothetical protein